VKNRFLTRGVAQPVFRGASGVNGFAQRFAELRSFAAKNSRSRENNRERMLGHARGKRRKARRRWSFITPFSGLRLHSIRVRLRTSRAARLSEART